MRRRLAWVALLGVLVAGCGGEDPPPASPPPATATAPATPEASPEAPVTPAPGVDTPDPASLGPLDTLEAWISAQEAGDFGWVMTFLVEAEHERWMELAEEMSTDDLISSGLGFRDEDYQLTFSDDKLAVFWSEQSRLYLVMSNEDGRWKVDPGKTDEMNVQAAGS